MNWFPAFYLSASSWIFDWMENAPNRRRVVFAGRSSARCNLHRFLGNFRYIPVAMARQQNHSHPDGSQGWAARCGLFRAQYFASAQGFGDGLKFIIKREKRSKPNFPKGPLSAIRRQDDRQLQNSFHRRLGNRSIKATGPRQSRLSARPGSLIKMYFFFITNH